MPPKKDPDSTALHKALKLFIILLTSGGTERRWSLTDLKDKLKCSKQTVTNLSKALSATGWGIVETEIDKEDRQKYFKMVRPFRTLPLPLTRESMESLELCLNMSGKIMPDGLKQDLERSRQVMANYLPRGVTTQSAPSVTLSKGHINYTPFEDRLQTLLSAINKQVAVELEYRKNINEDSRTYFFAPKGIMNYRESIYITGWWVEPKGNILEPIEERTFALQRICKVTMGTDSTTNIEMPQGLEDGSFGVMEYNPFNLKARFSAEMATYINERQWSDDQKIKLDPEDGSLTLKMHCRSTPEAIIWISSFGPEVQVISPAWLVKEIKERMALTIAVYDQS